MEHKEPSRQTAAVKVERCGEEEDGMELASLKRMAGGIQSVGGEALFIAKPPFTSLLIVGENVAGRTEAWRLGRSSCNCQDARIFATRAAEGDACIFCTRPCWRDHLWRMQEE